MDAPETFDEYYEPAVKPVLVRYERKRKTICLVLLALVIVAPIVLIGLMLAVARLDIPIISVPVFLGLVAIAASVWHVMWRQYVSRFKTDVVGTIVRLHSPHLRYAPKEYVGKDRFLESLIFQQRIDRYHGKDLVRGKIGLTELAFSWIHAEFKTTKTDKKGKEHTKWHTIFRGLFVIADFNKDFKGATVVIPDTTACIFGSVGRTILGIVTARPGKLVKLEDPEFEREFAVYGEDQVEARYVLSPALMERIRSYRKKIGTDMHISFVHSNIYVAIPVNGDTFEPCLFRSIVNRSLARRCFEALEQGTGIVEDLDLNTRIWSKG